MTHPFIPVPNTALVETVYSYGGQIMENTWHVTKGSPFSPADLVTLANAFDAWDNTGASAWKTIRVAACTLLSIKTKALDTVASPVYILTEATPRAGTLAAGVPMPGNVTFAVTLQTGLAGRSYRGRIYVPGISTVSLQSAPNQGLLASTVPPLYVASINALIAQIAAISGWHLCVVSYRNGGAWRVTGVATNIQSAGYANLAIDSQRRRLPGRGL